MQSAAVVPSAVGACAFERGYRKLTQDLVSVSVEADPVIASAAVGAIRRAGDGLRGSSPA